MWLCYPYSTLHGALVGWLKVWLLGRSGTALYFHLGPRSGAFLFRFITRRLYRYPSPRWHLLPAHLQVIKGWDQAVATMRRGEHALLTIRPDYGYGARGSGQKIPPDAWLQFDVELIDWVRPYGSYPLPPPSSPPFPPLLSALLVCIYFLARGTCRTRPYIVSASWNGCPGHNNARSKPTLSSKPTNLPTRCHNTTRCTTFLHEFPAGI